MKNMAKLFIIFVLLSIVFSASQVKGQLFYMENEQVGQKAPEFNLKNLDGKDVTLTDFRQGKNTIVFFWATWCPHCRNALKDLNAKKAEMEKNDVRVALVDIGEEAGAIKAYVDQHKIAFDVLLDKDSKVATEYGVIGVPTFVYINKDGIVSSVLHELSEGYMKVFEKK